LGGLARFYLADVIQHRAGIDFPAGTLVINITGSFLIGFFLRYALQSAVIGPEMRIFLTTGFCGGYTTFSTFSYETITLLQDGEYGRASLYVGSSVAFALAATVLGIAAANWLLALRQNV
ncbi:MAG TPA: fluoride efflux transporter CrcB, partial [Gemmatimonadaceae bacterium]|nr:fluoride efflux transporter CrcB [Gemmatimonadaceae bacterium]